jgi:hypothetical protein
MNKAKIFDVVKLTKEEASKLITTTNFLVEKKEVRKEGVMEISSNK